MNRFNSISAFEEAQAELAQGWDESRPCLRVCDGTGCRAGGSAGRAPHDIADSPDARSGGRRSSGPGSRRRLR